MKISVSSDTCDVSAGILKRCFAIAVALAIALEKESTSVAESVEVIKVRFGHGYKEGVLSTDLITKDPDLYSTYCNHFVEWIAIVNLGWSKKFEVKTARSIGTTFPAGMEVLGEKGKFATINPLPEERDTEISDEMKSLILEKGYEELLSLRFDVEDRERMFKP